VSAGTSATTAADNVACTAGTGQKFLAIQITGIACNATAGGTFLAINDIIDGAGEASPMTSGRIRCAVSGTGTPAINKDVVYYLSVPLT
jgi:hypothetical protein